MKKLIYLFYFTMSYGLGFAQNYPFTLPEIIPHSPEARGIAKFGDIPVSTYTGVPDISIPIYTVKAGKLSLPITLSYHASGIEVAQEATWVGLGWNLIAGGSISYIQVGGDDRLINNISPNDFQTLIRYVGSNSSSPACRTEDGCVGFPCSSPVSDATCVNTSMLTSLLGGGEQQDVYSANFGNYSFKFIGNPLFGITTNNQYSFLPYDKYLMMGQLNKCKIEDFILTYNTAIDKGFIITGDDGTIFRFEDIEIGPNTKALNWVLTKMISPFGDIITLTYKKILVKNLPYLNEQYTIRDGLSEPPIRSLTPATERYVPYLETIETKNELIKFDSDNTRNDVLNGGCKLNKITIIDKINNIEKFSYSFVYNYFTNNNPIGGDYLSEEGYTSSNSNYSDAVKYNRLKLESLVQSSSNITNDNYIFTYYGPTTLPAKTSFALDHWGYYNGKENISPILGKSHTIIPNALPLVIGYPLNYGGIDNRFYTLQGAVRGASKDNSIYTAGMLKSIQYPTKGKTEFIYEPHDFINYNYVSAEDETNINSPTSNPPKTSTVIAWGSTPYPVTNVTQTTFDLSVRSCVTLSGYTDYFDGAITISGPNYSTSRQGINQTNTNGHIAEWNEYLWLDAGTYTLTCTTPSQNISSSDMKPEIWAQITYNYDNQASNGNNNGRCSTCSYIGGGLRVKNIINYDENNNVVTSKRYSYISENGSSSGQLLIPLQNIYKKSIIKRTCPHNPPLDTKIISVCTLYGSSYVSLSGYLTGNNVGYSRIVIESYNYNNNINNGKEIDYFDNTPGLFYFSKIPFFPSTYNGNLVKKVILNTSGDTLITEKSNYSLLSGTNNQYTLNVLAEDTYEGPTTCGDGSGCPSYPGRLNMYAYPLQNFFNVLFSRETTNYFSNGQVKETVNYEYNPENFCLKSSQVSTSVANTNKTTEYKYPFNYSDLPYTNMVQKNIISPVIEQTDKVNTTILQNTKTNYKDWFSDQKIFAPETVVTTIGSSPADIRIRYKYDNQGNIIEASKENDMKISYIWGYNDSYPVVKIEGKAEADISQTLRNTIASKVFLGKADYTSINTDKSWLKTQLTDLMADKTCLVYFYTYDRIFGITSTTDPNGVTTYYEYDTFGRLKCIKDDDGHILKTYEYHYKP